MKRKRNKPSPSKQFEAVHPESIEAIAARLRLIRLAFGRLQRRERPIGQAEFSRLCGISPPAWNNAETGDNRLGIDAAKAVAKRTGADLDYIYFGTRDHLSYSLALVIEQIEREETTRAKSIA